MKPTKPFKSDGCSIYPDQNFRSCCYKHDKEYWKGGDLKLRKKADKKLMKCIGNKGHKIQSKIMYGWIRVGGHPIFRFPFRWGFGHKYPKYK